MNINAIQQGIGDALLIFGNDSRRTPTGLLWVIEPSTWAGIHGGNQLKVYRKSYRAKTIHWRESIHLVRLVTFGSQVRLLIPHRLK